MTYDIDGDDEQWEPEIASAQGDDDGLDGFDADCAFVAAQLAPGQFTKGVEEKAERHWHPKYYAALERLSEQARGEKWSPAKIKKYVLALRKLMRTCVGDDAGFLRPEGDNNNPAPKPSTGFAVQQTKRRLSKADIAQRKRLLEIATKIKQSDESAMGTLLREAKGLLDHSKFENWVRTIPMEPRTARRRMAAVAR